MEGWVKFHRKLLENPIVCKDSDHLAVWTYLLLNATHKEYDSFFGGKRITLNPGQLITGRKSIATFLKINESKTQRILKTLENEQQIEQRTSNQNRLITILNWGSYQQNEQQNEQQVNNKRTTSEQRVNTNKNVKNIKNDNKKDIIVHFEKIWSLYPNKKGKSSITKSNAKMNELFKVSYEEMERAIERYKKDKEEWKAWQNGSTFFNTTYKDYIDKNYEEENQFEKETFEISDLERELLKQMEA